MRKTPDIRLSTFQRAVCVGTLLGDSSLSKPRTGKNFNLSCYHAAKQRDWLLQKHGWLLPVSRPIQWCEYLDRRDGKRRPGGRFHTVSIPCFTALAGMLYRHKTKIISQEYLDLFTEPVSLACLICDDGSWDGAGIAIASKQFTAAENRLFAGHLSAVFDLSISCCTNGKYPHIRITAASVERTLEFCRPFVPPSLLYKFGPPDYHTKLTGRVSKLCAWCAIEFLSYASATQRFCSRECATKGKPKLWTGGRSSPRR